MAVPERDNMKDPYVVILFPDDQKCVILDRGYNFLSEDILTLEKVSLTDIIESDSKFLTGQMIPQWALDFDKKNHRHIALWLKGPWT